MKKILRSLTLVVTGVAFLAVASVSPITNAASNGLGITPRKDYSVRAGKSVSDTLFISNLSLSDNLHVSITAIDFASQNETGAPALQLDEDAPMPPWSLRPFLAIQSSVEIEAGKSANIPVKIAIPEGQGAGSYYAAIKYQAVNADTEQQVNIAASSASLIFVTVPGQADERLDFRQFGTYVPDDAGGEGSFQTLFMGAEPQVLAYRLENKGNVAEQPAGSIVVENLFGRTVLEIEKANPKDQLALIGQTRRFEVCLKESVVTEPGSNAERVECTDPNLWPGRYTATLALYYGMNGNDTKEILVTASFWYIPWWFVITTVVVLLVLAAIIWLIVRNIRLTRRKKFRRK